MSTLTLIRYGLPALLLLSVGMWLGFHIEKGHLDALQRDYSAYRLQVAQEHEAAQKAAAAALEAQIAARNATEERNAQVIQTLQNRADSSVVDLARANRLLDIARASAGRSGVPQAADQPGTTPPSSSGSDERIAGLLVAAKAEAGKCADEWDALQAELAPQL